MGSVVKEKSGFWSIRYDGPLINGARNQKQEGGFKTKWDANKALSLRESEVLRGAAPACKDIKLNDFIDLWLEKLEKQKRAPKTILFYKSIAEGHIKPYFTGKMLTQIRGHEIEDYYIYLSENTELDITSIHHNHKTLRACLNKAIKWGYLTVSPMINVEPPPQKKALIEFWEPKQIETGLNIYKGTMFEWYVNTALLTGLRLGEICALNEKYIFFKSSKFEVRETSQRLPEAGIIYKETKTEDSTASMPLTAEMKKVFKERILEIKKERMKNANIYDKSNMGYLAVWPDGRKIDPDYISFHFTDMLKEYNKKAKPKDRLPQITFHGLRHSCATWLLFNGVDMKTLQEILRHSNYKTTADTYSHILMDKKREALESIKLTNK
jgi:integrase